jgi:MFS family permease
MRTQKLEANIWKYYIMRIFVKRLVWPILTIYLVRNQLTPTEIGIVFSVGTIVGMLFEVPSGVVADRIGRRASLTLSFIGQAFSMLVMSLSTGFWGFLIGNALFWVANSLFSGTHSAFVYETLHELGRKRDVKKVFGKATYISQVSTGFLFVGVPLLAEYSLRLPFYINTVVLFAAAILTWSFTEPERIKSVAAEEGLQNTSAFKQFFSQPLLLSLSLATGFLSGINGILENFRQLYLDFIHLDVAYFGLVYLALRFITGYCGTKTEWLEGKIGRRNLLLLLPAVSFATYIGLFLFNSFYGLLFIVLDGIQGGLMRPVEQEYIQALVSNEKRVTFLSIDNLIQNLIRAGAVFFGGFAIDRFGIQYGFFFAALLVVVVALPLFISFIRKAERSKLFLEDLSI